MTHENGGHIPDVSLELDESILHQAVEIRCGDDLDAERERYFGALRQCVDVVSRVPVLGPTITPIVFTLLLSLDPFHHQKITFGIIERIVEIVTTGHGG